MTEDIANRKLLHATKMFETLVQILAEDRHAEFRVVMCDPGDTPILMSVDRGEKGEIVGMVPIAEFLGYDDFEFTMPTNAEFNTLIFNTEEESQCLQKTQKLMAEILEASPESFFISNNESRH